MSLTRLLAGASLAVVSTSVFAQASVPRPDPLDPNAPTTNLTVPRTFDEYVPYREPKVMPWQDTNVAVSPASAVQSEGAGHGAHAGTKHDMGKMKMPEASAPTTPKPAGATQAEPGHKSPTDSHSPQAPAGDTDHLNHKM